MTNNNAAWKPARVPVPAHPLNVDADDLAGALAARRELGADAEEALVTGFLNRAGEAIDARVDHRIAQHHAAGTLGTAGEQRRNTGPRLALAIVSIALGIPLTGIAAAMSEEAGLVLVLIVWSAITIINVTFNRSQR